MEPVNTRRELLRTSATIAGLGVFGISATGTALGDPGKPNFGPSIYGDGEAWGTKGAATLPPPTDDNEQSYDKLFVVTNSNNPGTQLPVSEAAPGNPAYNGGRWFTHTATWTQKGLDDHGTVPILTRYGPASDPESLQFHMSLGHIEVSAGPPDAPGAPAPYFECPLLPVKD